MAESSLKSAALRAAARFGAPQPIALAAQPAATNKSNGEQAGLALMKSLSFGNAMGGKQVAPAISQPTAPEQDATMDDEGAEKKGRRSKGHLSSEATGVGLKHVFDPNVDGLLMEYTGSAALPLPSRGSAPIIAAAEPRGLVAQALSKAVDLSHGAATAPKVDEKPRFERKGQETSAGAKWFHLPKQELTPELKRDLLILRNRNVLDPKRHYKTAREDRRAELPKFFQVGTVVEGPHERQSSTARLTNKERKSSLVAALLADERFDAYAKRTLSTVHKRAKDGGRKAYKVRKDNQGKGRSSFVKHKGGR